MVDQESRWQQNFSELLSEKGQKLIQLAGPMLGQFFLNSRLAIMIIDDQGMVCDVNAGFSSLTMIPREKQIGKHIWTYLDDADKEKCQCDYLAFISSTKPFYQSTRKGIRGDGQEGVIRSQISRISGDKGETLGAIAVIEDITENERIAQELKRTRAFFMAAMNQIPIGITIVNWPDGKYMMINRATADIIRAPQDIVQQALGTKTRNIYQNYYPDGRIIPLEDLPIEQVLRGAPTIKNFEMRSSTYDGGDYWVLVSAAPIIDDQGVNIGAVAVFTDITERKTAEAERESLVRELQQKNEELENIIRVASHDLRSPLINLEAFAERFLRDSQSIMNHVSECPHATKQVIENLVMEQLPRSLEYFQASVAKLNNLINGLLSVSRAGRMPFTHEQLDMNALLQGIVKAKQYEIEEVAAQVQLDNIPSCCGDFAQLEQVFSNLLDNALKFRDTARPLQVRITGQAEGANVVYCIEDNGIGIAPCYQAHVWDLFHRLDPSGPTNGDGIGLTIVRGIINRHNGRTWLESEENKGSKFFIELKANLD